MACLVRKLALIAFAAVALVAAEPAGAQARDPITWGWIDNAPGSMPTGTDRDKGIEDGIRALLKERLTNHDHEEVQAPIPRVLSEIRAGNHWCATGFVKTAERETFARFSVPASFWLPPQVIVRRQRLPDFSARGELSLDTLLQTEALRTGVVRGRAYSPAIDALLLKRPPPQHPEYVDGLKMVLADRLDYVIELPIRASYHARRLGEDGALAGLPFKEMSGHIVTHVICPANDWGTKVIAEIDAVLQAERPTQRYRRIVERWSDDEGVRQIRALYDTVLVRGR